MCIWCVRCVCVLCAGSESTCLTPGRARRPVRKMAARVSTSVCLSAPARIGRSVCVFVVLDVCVVCEVCAELGSHCLTARGGKTVNRKMTILGPSFGRQGVVVSIWARKGRTPTTCRPRRLGL